MPNQYSADPRQVECVCLHCGRPFTIYRSLIRKSGRPYCSRACFHANKRSTHRCERCGHKFTIPRSHAGDRGQGKFCSLACKGTPPHIKRQIKTAATQRSRARKKNARGIATAEQIAARRAMWGGRCYICGGVATTIDHVIPLSRGGTNWPANLRPACWPCNLRKKDHPLSSLNLS